MVHILGKSAETLYGNTSDRNGNDYGNAKEEVLPPGLAGKR